MNRNGALFAIALSGCAVDSSSMDLGVAHESIVGGAEVGTCAWPSAVYLERGERSPCSGALVAPDVVVFAAHCMADGVPPTSAKFGESVASPAIEVKTHDCKSDPRFVAFPKVGRGHDFAYCRLDQPVTNVPLIPLSLACENQTLGSNSEIIAVGFGETETNQSGVKRAVDLPFHEIVGNEAYVGGDGKGTCYGDSGGPVFARLPNRQWRVLGITSWAPGECGDGEYATIARVSSAWLEQSAKIDVSSHPGVPLEPGSGQGSWADGCAAELLTTSSFCSDPPPSKSEDAGCALKTPSKPDVHWQIVGLAIAIGAHWRRSRRK